MRSLPKSIDETQVLLGGTGYVCGRGLATVVFADPPKYDRGLRG
jgi:hypothetical protein